MLNASLPRLRTCAQPGEGTHIHILFQDGFFQPDAKILQRSPDFAIGNHRVRANLTALADFRNRRAKKYLGGCRISADFHVHADIGGRGVEQCHTVEHVTPIHA